MVDLRMKKKKLGADASKQGRRQALTTKNKNKEEKQEHLAVFQTSTTQEKITKKKLNGRRQKRSQKNAILWETGVGRQADEQTGRQIDRRALAHTAERRINSSFG